ncbi:hypothetical protein [Nocardia beijingensis]|uniref:hypothetical protein n=1 Tax=Nocardia beijingensis TaxID=95162 RepID=UPI00082C1550|nr:hypothetical protein [Nocardia beijingensis]
MSSEVSGTSGRPTNPIVTAAAEQVATSKRRRRVSSKARELPRWECRDQMTLFDPSTSESDR